MVERLAPVKSFLMVLVGVEHTPTGRVSRVVLTTGEGSSNKREQCECSYSHAGMSSLHSHILKIMTVLQSAQTLMLR